MEAKKIVEEQEIWDKKEKAVKSEKKAKRLVPEHFHWQIYIFGKKQSERILVKIYIESYN